MMTSPLERAHDPTSTAHSLTVLAQHAELAVRLAVAANPSTPRDALDALLCAVGKAPGAKASAALLAAILGNPALAFLLIEDPGWLQQQPRQIVLALAASPSLTPPLWEGLSGHDSMGVKLALVQSAAAPPGAWGLLGLPADGIWYLSDAGLWGDDFRGLFCCPSLDTVFVIFLADCGLRDEDLAVLAGGPAFPALSDVDLSGNVLGEGAAEQLARSTSFPALARLNLSRNSLGQEGAAALARSTTFAGLEKLNLSENKLGDAGLVALARSTAFPALKELKLAWNEIGEEGIRALVQAPFFPALTSIVICPDKLSEAAQQILDEAAAAHPHLRLS